MEGENRRFCSAGVEMARYDGSVEWKVDEVY